MTVARFLLICFAFLVLALACAGYWLAQGYPENLEAAIQEALAPYGVEDIDLEALVLTKNSLQVEGLAFAGSSAEQRYSIAIEGLTVGYQWRDLLESKLDFVEIDTLSIVLSAAEAPSAEASEPLNLNDALPLEIVKRLPVSSFTIHQWELSGELNVSGTASYQEDKLTATAQTLQQALTLHASLVSELHGPLSLKINALHDGQHVANVAAALLLEATDGFEDATAIENWQWQLSGELHHSPLLAWITHPDSRERFASLSSIPLELHVEGSSVVEATITHAPFWPLQSAQHSPLGVALTGEADAIHKLKALALDGLLTADDFEAKTTFTLAQNRIAGAIEPLDVALAVNEEAFEISADTRKWLGYNDSVPVSLNLENAATIDWAPEVARATLGLEGLQLNAGNSSSRLKIALESLHATVTTEAPLAIDVNSAGTIKTRAHRQAWPEFAYQGTASGPLASNAIELNLVDAAQSLTIQLNGNVDLEAGSGSMNIDADTPDLSYAVSAISGPLKAYGMLEAPPTITSGRAITTTNIGFTHYGRDTFTQQSRINLIDATGQWGEYSFEKLAGEFAFKGIEQWQSTTAARVSLGAINVGFPVNDINVVFSLPKATSPSGPEVHIRSFSAAIFGGEVYLPEPAHWRVGAATNHITVNASGWELGQLVALQQGQEIDARGLLEGQLPLTVQDGRIIIEKGFLRAIPPGGSIRYQATDSAAALADSNEQLGMALELLEDFRFKVLSTDVKLDKAGNLLLGLALSGSNPTQFDGRQVNFNINLDQNIDPLLQSLRLSDTLVEQLEKRIR